MPFQIDRLLQPDRIDLAESMRCGSSNHAGLSEACSTLIRSFFVEAPASGTHSSMYVSQKLGLSKAGVIKRQQHYVVNMHAHVGLLEALQRPKQRAKHALVPLLHRRVLIVILPGPLGHGRLLR